MKYPLELKQKVLKDYFEGKDGIRGLERTYGIQHQLILSWIKTCQQPSYRMRQGKVPKEAALHLNEPPVFNDPRKELEYLRAENAYLREMLMLSGVRKNGRKKKLCRHRTTQHTRLLRETALQHRSSIQKWLLPVFADYTETK